MKKVAIVQSNYIPWKGYFDLIASVDEFILFDDMQFTRRDWRNRNLIKTPQGTQWLTVPVEVKGKFSQTIRETRIQDAGWAADHWKALCLNYRRAAYFEATSALFEPLYAARHESLSALNRVYLEAICGFLDIRTPITNSWDYAAAMERASGWRACAPQQAETSTSPARPRRTIWRPALSKQGELLSSGSTIRAIRSIPNCGASSRMASRSSTSSSIPARMRRGT